MHAQQNGPHNHTPPATATTRSDARGHPLGSGPRRYTTPSAPDGALLRPREPLRLRSRPLARAVARAHSGIPHRSKPKHRGANALRWRSTKTPRGADAKDQTTDGRDENDGAHDH